MRFLKRLAADSTKVVLAVIIAVAGITPALLVFAPQAVSAAACDLGAGGAGGGGSFNPVKLHSTASSVDSAAQKVGIEITPKANWGSKDFISSSIVGFANSSCVDSTAFINFRIGASNLLTVDYYDNTRSGAFVATTDYDNVFSGVTFNSGNNTAAEITYTIPAIDANIAQLVSFDLSNAGWVDVYLKTGSGTDNRLISFKLPAGATAFANYNGGGPDVTYNPIDTSFTSCSQITGSKEVLVRVLVDDVAVTQTATPTSAGLDCASFDKTSYDTPSKTASLKYDVAGAVVNHVIKDSSGVTLAATAGTGISINSSLALSPDGKIFKDAFSSGSSSGQAVYFTTSEIQDGKALPKDTPWPIASGTFDLSAKDIDIAANGVVLDTSATAYSAVAHNLNTITKDGTFTLYVPYRDKDAYVGVCPGAANLAAVTSKCNGIYYIKDGFSKNNGNTKSIPAGHTVSAKVITVGSKKFWQVDGLTGTGVLSSNIASDPATGISVKTTSLPMVIALMFATIGVAVLARRATVNVTVKKK